jgi:hypothetical protein
MVQNNKDLINEIKETIKELNKKTGAKLSYTKLYEDIEEALQPHMEMSRDTLLVQLYTEGIEALSEKSLLRRSLVATNPILMERYKNDPLASYTVTEAKASMNDLIVKMMTLQNPEFANSFSWNKNQENQIQDYMESMVRNRTCFSEWPKCFKKWDYQCFYKDIESIDKTFDTDALNKNGYKFKGKAENELDFKVAELFYKSSIIKAEIDGYGFFTRIFNRIFSFRKMGAYDAFLRKADEVLKKVGFSTDSEKDRGKAESILYRSKMPPYDKDCSYLWNDSLDKEKILNKEDIDRQKQIIAESGEITTKKVIDLKNKILIDSEEMMRKAEEDYFKEHNLDKSAPVDDKSDDNALFKGIDLL